jgi:NADP-reducing hydrogenase subunit HndB
MKTLAELEAIRKRAIKDVNIRTAKDGTRIVVGMATCGIAAGARPVLSALLEEVNKRELKGVNVTQTGCIGVCRLEPMVEVYKEGDEKVTYVQVDASMAARIVAEHIVNGNPIKEFTIGYAESK